jgi:alpha-galactosidase
MGRAVIASLACILWVSATVAQGALENNLAKTPPMGWNSWNCCGGSNETQAKAIADAMVSSGMQAAGYQYVVIDDGLATARDGSGNIGVSATLFPSGIKALADYIHGKGLKFGIYTSRGLTTCGGAPGSAGYEDRDAQQYAAWGVDFVKADGCGNGQNPSRTIAQALVATGRPIVLSVNEWQYNPGVDTTANMWRVRNDIGANWASMIDMVDVDWPLWPVARPGHWNDADMLQVGNGGLTLEENKTHFALWCMLAAPILAGNDLRTMSTATRDILTNTELIAVDQDSLGLQARRVMKQDSLEVWVKALRDSSRAVALLNRGPATARIGFNLTQLGWWSGLVCPVRDLCRKVDRGSVTDSLSDTVPSHGTVVFRVSKGPDHQGPRIRWVYNDTTFNRVYVVFNEPLDPTSAQTASNYGLDNGANVTGATLLVGGRTVLLTTSALTSGRAYNVTVTNVNDASTNAVPAGTGAQFTAAVRTVHKLTGTAIGAGEPFGGNAAVAYTAAMDGNLATFADLSSARPLYPLYAGYDLGAGTAAQVTGVAYAPRNALYADRMVGMQVQGSDDGVTWTTLYTITAAPPVGVLTRQTITASRPYRYVRLEGTAGFLNVAEVEFYGYEVGVTAVAVVAGRGATQGIGKVSRPRKVLGVLLADRRLAGCEVYDLSGARINPGRATSEAGRLPQGVFVVRSAARGRE